MSYIDPTATIGSPAFSYRGPERERKASSFPPQIHEGVDIFGHANVDMGITRPTVIGRNSKIDHYAHIGHDSILGPHVIVCAGAIVAGYCEIGEGAYIGVGAVIRNKRKVGAHAQVGMGAVVVDDVPPGAVVWGNPARIRRYKEGFEPPCSES